MGFSLPDSGDAANPKATGDSVKSAFSSNEIVTTMTLDPTHEPSVPTGLVWMAHEPIWREVAKARLESGLQKCSIDVRSTDDFGVDASLKALIENVGFDSGRSLRRTRRDRTDGEFAS